MPVVPAHSRQVRCPHPPLRGSPALARLRTMRLIAERVATALSGTLTTELVSRRRRALAASHAAIAGRLGADVRRPGGIRMNCSSLPETAMTWADASYSRSTAMLAM